MESVAWMQNKWTFCTNAVVEQQVEIKVSLLVPGSAVGTWAFNWKVTKAWGTKITSVNSSLPSRQEIPGESELYVLFRFYDKHLRSTRIRVNKWIMKMEKRKKIELQVQNKISRPYVYATDDSCPYSLLRWNKGGYQRNLLLKWFHESWNGDSVYYVTCESKYHANNRFII